MKNKFMLLIALMFTLCISTEICADETLAEKVVGSWYICYHDAAFINEYQFNEDGTVTEKQIDGLGQGSFSYDRFTYEIGDNIIRFTSIGVDGSADHFYNIDAGQYALEFLDEVMHLVFSASTGENIEWFLYPTAEQAIEYSDTYKYTDEYLSLSADEDGFVIEEGVLKGYFGDELEITVPENVNTISTYAFMSSDMRATNLKSVIVPGTVKKLDDSAFSYSGVKTIYLEEGVEEIGDSCFYNSYLSDLYIPESVKVIGDDILETDGGYDGLVVHCIKKSVAWNHFKEYTPYGSFKYKGDYNSFTGEDENGIRSSSVVLLIASSICIIGMVAYGIIKFLSVRKKQASYLKDAK